VIRRFDTCPFCGWRSDTGFTGIEFRYDLAEVWLSNGSYIEHKHLGMNLPDPHLLALGGDGGRLTIANPFRRST